MQDLFMYSGIGVRIGNLGWPHRSVDRPMDGQVHCCFPLKEACSFQFPFLPVVGEIDFGLCTIKVTIGASVTASELM